MRVTKFLVATLLFFGSVVNVNASLVVQDENTIFDDVNGLLWYRDLSFFISQNYSEQLATINTLNGEWRLASQEDMSYLKSYSLTEITDVFLHSDTIDSIFSGGSGEAWLGRYDLVGSLAGKHWVYGMDNAGEPLHDYEYMIDDEYGGVAGAWVVKNVSNVPIPSAVWLLGSGLVGIVGYRKRKKL